MCLESLILFIICFVHVLSTGAMLNFKVVLRPKIYLLSMKLTFLCGCKKFVVC